MGKYFAQDGLEFLRWAARYFRVDNVTLCVLLHLMGSQEIGGHVELKQVDIAEALEMDPARVSRAQTKLKRLGLAHSPKKGSINVVDKPVRGAARRQVKVHVDQLSLLNELVVDQDVPEEFRTMALPGARLPEPAQAQGQAEAEAGGVNMRTAASVNPEPPELTYGTLNDFAYLPAMPGIAYRVLFRLLGTQEPGGRCLVTEDDLADAVEVHRSLVGRGLQALIHARLVFRQTKGVYLFNHMISEGGGASRSTWRPSARSTRTAGWTSTTTRSVTTWPWSRRSWRTK
ncbi:hypothetical protein GCM10022384_33030 [Streptomyces marokkonensis]|uniref:Uncharacterized protein n=1 Tax=Streptomyces marokkonensis TaxID=324855 RepID=A0ABP7QFF1_9ACTN